MSAPLSPRPIHAAVLTISDRCSRGQATDTSGPALCQMAQEKLQAQIIAAQDIVSALDACSAEPARSAIHAKMRAYAQNTLRLIVSDQA